MAVAFPDSLLVSTGRPLDAKSIFNTLAERDNLPISLRFKGMVVCVKEATNQPPTYWCLNSEDLSNNGWAAYPLANKTDGCVPIPSGADFNTYIDNGMYSVENMLIATSCQNCPVPFGGVLSVDSYISGGSTNVVQEYKTYENGNITNIYIRVTNNSVVTWGVWERVAKESDIGGLFLINDNEISTDTTYSSFKITRELENVVATIPAGGLKVPVVINAESNLPLPMSRQIGDHFYIQNMDVTAEGHTGRAWVNHSDPTDKTSQLVYYKVFDQYFTPDMVSIVLTQTGQLGIDTEWLDGFVSERLSSVNINVIPDETDLDSIFAHGLYAYIGQGKPNNTPLDSDGESFDLYVEYRKHTLTYHSDGRTYIRTFNNDIWGYWIELLTENNFAKKVQESLWGTF